MKKSTKAALLSALVFPGAGLLWLKQYVRAAIFIIPAIAISYYIFNEAMKVATTLSNKIANSEISPDFTTLLNEVHLTLEQIHLKLEHAIWLFLICWGMSIASSYFAGKKIELDSNNSL